MADDAQDSDKTQDLESRIRAAIVSRTSYFQEQADTLTIGKVRRLLEEDLGLETHALDSHKRLVKKLLEPFIDSAPHEKLPKSQGNNGEKAASSTEREEPVIEPQAKKDLEDTNFGGGEMMEDSPIMGLMTGGKNVKANTDEAEDTKSEVVPREAIIKKALWKRASYLRDDQSISLAGVRRLLEEDLGLAKLTLDPFKKFIRQQVDEVLNSAEIPQKDASDKKKTAKKEDQGNLSSKASREETPTTSGDKSEEFQEDEVKSKKRPASKAKREKSEPVRKRKKEVDTKVAKRKQSKVSKSVSEESGEEDGGGVSEDDNSASFADKPVKKKEVLKSSYGKKVEHLKSVIKSCGMSIPPVIYKKVKQAPENKREACLIKELEELLSKEGLSTNPSEKDIKEIKRKKERAKELEGIDLSNIVSSSRRRSATSFAPPPKPKIPDLSESESEESEDDGEDEDDEEGGDEEVEDEEAADENQENGCGSTASEASEEDNSDSD